MIKFFIVISLLLSSELIFIKQSIISDIEWNTENEREYGVIGLWKKAHTNVQIHLSFFDYCFAFSFCFSLFWLAVIWMISLFYAYFNSFQRYKRVSFSVFWKKVVKISNLIIHTFIAIKNSAIIVIENKEYDAILFMPETFCETSIIWNCW